MTYGSDLFVETIDGFTWLAEWLVWLGEWGFWWYVLPLLVWTLLAGLVVGGLRLTPRKAPSSRLPVLQALLFSLPLGLVLALVAGGALSGGPIAEAREVVAEWARRDPAPAASTPTLSPEGTVHVMPGSAVYPLESLYFWTGLFMIGALGLSLKRVGRLASEVWTLRRYRRALPFVPAAVRARAIAPLERRFGFTEGHVEYRVAPAHAMPVTFGWWQPVVALPRTLFSNNSSARSELRMTLLHELTHVRRRDYLARWASAGS